MTKWFACLLVFAMLAVLVHAAAAKPVAMSDGQLSAIAAGELEVEDNNLAGVGGDGTAVGDSDCSFNDYSDNQDYSQDNDPVTVTKTDVDKDLDVDVDDSLNTDNSTDNSTTTVTKTDVDKDLDVDVDDSLNTDNSTTTVTKDSNNTDNSTTTVTKTDVDKDLDVDVDDSLNTDNSTTTVTKDSNNTDNSQDNDPVTVTKTEKKIEDSVILQDDAQRNARAINLVNSAGGDVGVGTNIFVLAAQSSASSAGNADDAKVCISDSSVNQIVANFSTVSVGVLAGVSVAVDISASDPGHGHCHGGSE